MKSKQEYKNIHDEHHYDIHVSLLARGLVEEGYDYEYYYIFHRGRKRGSNRNRAQVIRHWKKYSLCQKKKTRGSWSPLDWRYKK